MVILAHPKGVEEKPHIPRSIKEVDNGKILGFGADLAEDHPVCSSYTLASFVVVCVHGVDIKTDYCWHICCGAGRRIVYEFEC